MAYVEKTQNDVVDVLDLLSRRRVLDVQPQILCDLIKAGRFHVVEVVGGGLPEDVRVVRWEWQADRNVICLTLVSSEWDVIPDHYVAPQLDPVSFTRYHGEEAIVRRLREREADQANRLLAEVT